MEYAIAASTLNDFMFCPMSIYFHGLYSDRDTITYQNTDQINGTQSHLNVDSGKYSTSAHVLSGIEAFSEQYNLCCKIDIFDTKSGILTERKKKVHQVFDGFIFQLYAQYYCLSEMGYDVKELRLHSIDDNKNYTILLPDDDIKKKIEFEELIHQFITFDPNVFQQENPKKCAKCIYEPACDRSISL